MNRQTSKKAYREIKAEGLLSKMRFIVYDFIYQNGPVTQKQAIIQLGKGRQKGGTFTGRFSELENIGVIKIVGETVCEDTGRSVHLWDVTPDLPKPLVKKVTRADKKKIIIKKLGIYKNWIEAKSEKRNLISGKLENLISLVKEL